MSLSPERTFEPITVDTLTEKVRSLRQEGWRLVQISATRLPQDLQLTYSFDLESRLANYRLVLPAEGARIPSISSIYWCAFLYENELHDLFGLQVDGMAIDFKGNFYRTAVKYAFGAPKATTVPAPASASAIQAASPAPAKLATGPTVATS